MGPAVWLFGWLVHRQTRERHGVGLVLAGSPLTYEIISEDTGMAVRTLKRWMARLGRSGYIHVTHSAHKRMIIRINKAKKFGPQQLEFPQKSTGFPQIPFFARDSKGPHLAPNGQSKGPDMAREIAPNDTQAPENAESWRRGCSEHREFKPERKETKPSAAANSPHTDLPTRSENAPATPPKSPTNEKFSHRNHWRVGNRAQQTYRPVQPLYEIDRRTLREMQVRAELYAGAGPEIHRE